MASPKLRTAVDHILRHLPKPGNHKQLPLVVGLCGPQGSGKTTLTRQLVTTLQGSPYNLNVVSFSVDDLYLPFERQCEVASSNPKNRLLQYRGNAGTHDLDLGQLTFERLLKSHDQYVRKHIADPVPIPQYNKASRNGRGDQEPLSNWPKVSPPYDIILFEGWMLGFKALPEQELRNIYARSPANSHVRKFNIEEIIPVNDYLRSWSLQVYSYLDVFIHIDTEDIDFVYDWRWEQEEHMRSVANNRNIGLTSEEVKDFVDRFMPAYELYLPRLRNTNLFVDLPEPNRSIKTQPWGRHLRLLIDKNRNMLSSTLVDGKSNL
ncbi:P-loop containing nucleoside triphosphate hydrolase protein [Basidiobolus meristosporus CBS 931.73]|uniref:p-loop containing nucleoside triphosphate hydrolase protein n=1 Tax=Basidiobolus meristosporus CBS 931.73 TaxID=1314790 RepID=A0A1Y1XUZ2_9FUNG|nr:P-loop containing nucleoside triphosphate hydrolase protein [Basidiobolus meristosporus CBS 931.73]|eukprot:ORX89495.1 P-loop containing nucleoside triphosphate hydrolase protein [Basidiobolus meristosporus CBS 931.73]